MVEPPFRRQKSPCVCHSKTRATVHPRCEVSPTETCARAHSGTSVRAGGAAILGHTSDVLSHEWRCVCVFVCSCFRASVCACTRVVAPLIVCKRIYMCMDTCVGMHVDVHVDMSMEHVLTADRLQPTLLATPSAGRTPSCAKATMMCSGGSPASRHRPIVVGQSILALIPITKMLDQELKCSRANHLSA